MPPLSAFDRAWVAAEAACPLGWTVRGVVRGPREVDPAIHGNSWVAWARPEKPTPDMPPIIEGKGDSAFEAGEDLATVRRALGHTSVATTADTYMHTTPAMRERLAARMDAVLSAS